MTFKWPEIQILQTQQWAIKGHLSFVCFEKKLGFKQLSHNQKDEEGSSTGPCSSPAMPGNNSQHAESPRLFAFPSDLNAARRSSTACLVQCCSRQNPSLRL